MHTCLLMFAFVYVCVCVRARTRSNIRRKQIEFYFPLFYSKVIVLLLIHRYVDSIRGARMRRTYECTKWQFADASYEKLNWICAFVQPPTRSRHCIALYLFVQCNAITVEPDIIPGLSDLVRYRFYEFCCTQNGFVLFQFALFNKPSNQYMLIHAPISKQQYLTIFFSLTIAGFGCNNINIHSHTQ